MKKLLLLLLCVSLMFSCNKGQKVEKDKNENIVIKNNLKEIIKDPCDLMSYCKEIILKLEEISDKHENIRELDRDERKQVNDYIFYIKEAWSYSYNKFPSFDIGRYEDCNEWAEFDRQYYSPFDKVIDFYPNLFEEIDSHANRLKDEQRENEIY